jgi:RNA polymerase sigma-70 factor, ECF subfamily
VVDRGEVEAVLDQVGRGNRDAFRLVVRAYGLPLRGYLASQVHHPGDVDDLAQEVFLAAYRRLATFRRGDDFGAWLRGIARHKLQDHFRSTGRRDRAVERFRAEVARVVEGDLDRAAADDTAESVEALLRCIARLPEKLRRVVRAGLDGHKPADLADELVTTVGAVYNLHYRANQRLRDCVRKELE